MAGIVFRVILLAIGFYVLHATRRVTKDAGDAKALGLASGRGRVFTDASGPQPAGEQAGTIGARTVTLPGGVNTGRQLNGRLPTRRLEELCAALVARARLRPGRPAGRPGRDDGGGEWGRAEVGVPPVFGARAYLAGDTAALTAVELHPLADEEQLSSLAALGEAAVLGATTWPESLALRGDELRLGQATEGGRLTAVSPPPARSARSRSPTGARWSGRSTTRPVGSWTRSPSGAGGDRAGRRPGSPRPPGPAASQGCCSPSCATRIPGHTRAG